MGVLFCGCALGVLLQDKLSHGSFTIILKFCMCWDFPPGIYLMWEYYYSKWGASLGLFLQYYILNGRIIPEARNGNMPPGLCVMWEDDSKT